MSFLTSAITPLQCYKLKDRVIKVEKSELLELQLKIVN